MPSIRSRPEGPKYGKKLTLDTLGGIKFIWTSSPHTPFSTCCNTCQGFYCSHRIIMCNIEFIFVLLFVLFYYYKTSNKLIVKKISFSKIVWKITILVNIFATLYVFFVIFNLALHFCCKINANLSILI